MHLNAWTWHPGMILLAALLVMPPAWRICSKAGYPGGLAHLWAQPVR